MAGANDVSLLSLVDPREDSSDRVRTALSYCRQVRIVPHSTYVIEGVYKRVLQAASLLTPFSFEHAAFRSTALQAAFDDLVEHEAFDLIQFEYAQMASTLERASAHIPHVLDEHNIEYDVLRRTATAEGSRVRKAYNAVNWRKLHMEERRVWRRFEGSTLTSERDRELLLEDAPLARARVVPNGVDVGEFAPDPQTPVEADTVLFFGAINYYPNTDGVLFFLRDVLPKLKKRRPGVRVRIVGQKPPPAIASWSDPAVDVIGYVDDVRQHIARAAAVVVPLRIGGGTRLKVLEAMAMGKAVVSTSLGAEGIDVVSGRDVLLGDDPDALVEHLGSVLDHDDLGRRLGGAARELVTARYSWRASAASLSDFHAELVQSKRAA
jgi:glycosyltransferase involved in cell wall biosynthesis